MDLCAVRQRILRSAPMVFFYIVFAIFAVSAERSLKSGASRGNETAEIETVPGFLLKAVNFLWQSDETGYHHVWPVTDTDLFALSCRASSRAV